MTDLTKRVLSERNGTGRKALLEDIYLLVYRYPLQQFGRHEEECAGFFLYCHTCVTRMVDRFQDQGSDFEAYLAVFLRYKLKGYRMQQQAQQQHRADAQEDWFRNGYTAREEQALPSYTAAIRDTRLFSRCRSTELRRRELLLLICCLQMSDDQVSAAAAGLGLDPEATVCRARQLRERAEPRRKRKEMLGIRIDRCRARIRMLERRAEREPLERSRRELAAQVQAEQRRLAQLRTVRALVPTRASHRDVAEVLGIPKGTVDSGMYYLQRQFAAESGGPYDSQHDPGGQQQSAQAFRASSHPARRGPAQPC